MTTPVPPPYTSGNDSIVGGTSADYLVGGAGNDTLTGSGGDDTLDAGTGYNEVNGGAGNDLYIIRSRADLITEYVPDEFSGAYSGASDSAVIFTIGVVEPTVRFNRGFGGYWDVPFIENLSYAPGVVADLPYWVSALAGDTSSQLSAIRRAAQGDNTLYFYFPDTMPAFADATGWSPLSATERTFVRQALAYISTVVDLHFVEATDDSHSGTITFETNLQSLGAIQQYGYTYMPDSAGNSSIYYNTALRSVTFTRGSDVLHEIGHALGLGHPAGILSTTEDTLAWSVMSYRGGARSNFAYSPFDIAALQSIYGPSKTSRTGSNTYVLNAAAPNMVWDGGGTDAIDGSAQTAAIHLSLMEGYWGYIGATRPSLMSAAGSITINVGTTIENALGGGGSDAITGNYVDNSLSGNGGNDTLDGLGGNDTIIGGAGIDVAVLHGLRQNHTIASTGPGSYTVTDTRDGVVYSDGADSLSGIERLQFDDGLYFLTTSGNDSVVGSGGNDLIDGQGGNDSIAAGAGGDSVVGGLGNDVLDGGAGTDTMLGGAGDDIYVVDVVSDVVDEGDGLGGDAGGDDTVRVALAASGIVTLSAFVEAGIVANAVAAGITGNSLGNRLTGNAAANTLSGAGGDDTIEGGAGGDILDGGANGAFGDTASYRGAALAVQVSLALQGAAQATGGAGADVLTGFENLEGSAFGDVLTGDGNANTLTGNAGGDTLDGGAGLDTLIGGLGGDVYVVDDPGDVVVEQAGQGADTVRSLAATYTLSDNVERLVLLGSGDINGVGSAQANQLVGNAGANSLDGGGGADTLVGGAGNDTYTVDTLADVITELAGQGLDTVLSTIGWTLGGNLENLTLQGGASVKATGNGLANGIVGNDGDNILAGKGGNDVLTGGSGSDDFVFDVALSAATNLDHVTDFTAGVDQIWLENAIFTTVGAAGALSAEAFFAGSDAHDVSDRILYDQATGALFYDRDGTGVAAKIEFAVLDTHPALQSIDFKVI